jgi:NAD(P)-dependent dehydrogenase (short-subunit alcohol dehydrogenase family)
MKKNILITGASRGLGHDLAEVYLADGCRVFACARGKNSPKLEALKNQFGEDLQIIEMDIASSGSVQKAAVQVKALTDRLDIIVNNAGIHADDSFKVLEEINVDNCLEVYNVNALGALRVAQQFAALLEKGTVKALVNISSESGSIANCPREKEFDYCMSKAALNMESVLLQNYFKGKGIKVLAVHPGWFRSDMGGPNAHLAVREAAEGVAALIVKFGSDPAGPVFVDYKGNVMEF